MDDETKKALGKIMDILDNPNEGLKAIIKSCMNSESQINSIYSHMDTVIGDLQLTMKTVTELKEQMKLNCTKQDSMDKKLDDIIEIVTANGQGIEVLSKRLDKVENY